MPYLNTFSHSCFSHSLFNMDAVCAYVWVNVTHFRWPTAILAQSAGNTTREAAGEAAKTAGEAASDTADQTKQLLSKSPDRSFCRPW